MPPQSDEKSSGNLEFSNKRLHNQINPAVRDGVVRQEFADLLEKKEYTPETIAQWDKQAMEWILKQGGVYPAGQALLNDKAPAKDAVAELVRRHILNSDVFATAFDLQERIKLNEQHIESKSEWGRHGRAMQLNALKLDNIAAVQALLNKLHENMPPPEVQKLRNPCKKVYIKHYVPITGR